ncbi:MULTISPECIES: hypothetical protein [unclassified Nocardioides]|uniref:hypothetical protein n=1 Tax=unclassified Nocardioides TaxID=2615069 RepID=UPI0007024F79|nr:MULTISPECIES: hypothetical protein [unclassified Nocardioides]KRC59487.1 hypothetical protein ASE19_00130 [Nocardioides sp. Root79]KRC68689.1 hypothetical protein ASE20_17835 [Nocardioides sp. Root240]
MTEHAVVDRFLDAIERADIDHCDAWAPGATLAATVPNWRFHRTGADAIRETYRGWFADPGSFERLRREPVSGGEVVEYDLTWWEDGVPHLAHHVHLLTVADDRIVADVVLCGGRWSAGLLAEMEAADA